MKIFIDTSAWIALFVKQDIDHTKCSNQYKK